MLAALLFATIHSVDFRDFAYDIEGQSVPVHDGKAKVPDKHDPGNGDRRLLAVMRNHSSSCMGCTDAVIESRYRWNGDRFVLVSRSISPRALTLRPSGTSLLVTLPGRDAPSIEVLFPEHVTAKRRGSDGAEHLYLNRAGDTPAWRNTGDGWEYERELPHDIHMVARATVQDDGILFHYELLNRGDTTYDWIEGVTDPRMRGEFHDERLERTYVHHADGFAPLAERPVHLPARYLASYRWPVPSPLVQRGDDGVMHVNKSRRVDEPFIVTQSIDRQWVVASFARDAGNVWSNPELTCQHVDPQAPLAAHGRVALEVKLLVMRGSLDDALRHERAQRGGLAP